MLQKIIVAIDGSSSAIHAAHCAVKLAKQVNAYIELVYVVRYAIGSIDAGVLPDELEKIEKQNADQLIEKIKKKHRDVSIQSFEPIGKPIEMIQEAIDKWDADLIIIGHHTHNFIEDLFYGSVEKQLLKHLRIPMLVIPEDYEC